ncbi:MAG: DUF4129 domain-containing protein [Thermomicrobiales bacterium]
MASEEARRPAGARGGALARLVSRLDWSLELLVLALVAAETCAVYLVVTALFSSAHDGGVTVSPLALFLLLLLGADIQRLMNAYRFFSPEYEFFSIIAIVVLLCGAVWAIAFPHYAPVDPGWVREALHALIFRPSSAQRSVWGVVLLVAYAWWRGRTRDDPDLDAAYRLLRVGTIVCLLALLATLSILASVGATPGMRRALYLATIVFLACALTAIALARLRVEQARGALTLTPRWLATFLGPVAGLMLVGTLFAGLFTRRTLEVIVWLLTPVFWVFNLILVIIVYIATLFAWIIFTLITFVLQAFGITGEGAQAKIQMPHIAPAHENNGIVHPVNYPDPFRYVAVLGALALVVWVLSRFLWRRRLRRPTGAGEERESVFSWGLLAAGLGDLLAGLTGRFGPRPDPLAHLRGDPRWQYTLYIRETYRRLLHRAAAANWPRAEHQTPDEYAPVVSAAGTTDPARTAVETITTRYDGARYSDQPATAEDAAAARAAWDVWHAAELRRGTPRPESPHRESDKDEGE